jgi:hypothetical protein
MIHTPKYMCGMRYICVCVSAPVSDVDEGRAPPADSARCLAAAATGTAAATTAATSSTATAALVIRVCRQKRAQGVQRRHPMRQCTELTRGDYKCGIVAAG